MATSNPISESIACGDIDACSMTRTEAQDSLITSTPIHHERDDATTCPAQRRLMQTVRDVFEFDRKTDILQIVPKRRKSTRMILLFDDLQTTLLQDCIPIDVLVRHMLDDYTVKRRHPTDRNAPCAVCTEDLEGRQYIRVLDCGHSFHCGCIRKAFLLGNNAKCPLCRHDFLDDFARDNLADPNPDDFVGKTVVAQAILIPEH